MSIHPTAYYQYASGASSLLPRHHLDLGWNMACCAAAENLRFGFKQFGCLAFCCDGRHDVPAMKSIHFFTSSLLTAAARARTLLQKERF